MIKRRVYHRQSSTNYINLELKMILKKNKIILSQNIKIVLIKYKKKLKKII